MFGVRTRRLCDRKYNLDRKFNILTSSDLRRFDNNNRLKAIDARGRTSRKPASTNGGVDAGRTVIKWFKPPPPLFLHYYFLRSTFQYIFGSVYTPCRIGRYWFFIVIMTFYLSPLSASISMF